jgi:hypothetical protein
MREQRIPYQRPPIHSCPPARRPPARPHVRC